MNQNEETFDHALMIELVRFILELGLCIGITVLCYQHLEKYAYYGAIGFCTLIMLGMYRDSVSAIAYGIYIGLLSHTLEIMSWGALLSSHRSNTLSALVLVVFGLSFKCKTLGNMRYSAKKCEAKKEKEDVDMSFHIANLQILIFTVIGGHIGYLYGYTGISLFLGAALFPFAHCLWNKIFDVPNLILATVAAYWIGHLIGGYESILAVPTFCIGLVYTMILGVKRSLFEERTLLPIIDTAVYEEAANGELINSPGVHNKLLAVVKARVTIELSELSDQCIKKLIKEALDRHQRNKQAREALQFKEALAMRVNKDINILAQKLTIEGAKDITRSIVDNENPAPSVDFDKLVDITKSNIAAWILENKKDP